MQPDEIRFPDCGALLEGIRHLPLIGDKRGCTLNAIFFVITGASVVCGIGSCLHRNAQEFHHAADAVEDQNPKNAVMEGENETTIVDHKGNITNEMQDFRSVSFADISEVELLKIIRGNEQFFDRIYQMEIRKGKMGEASMREIAGLRNLQKLILHDGREITLRILKPLHDAESLEVLVVLDASFSNEDLHQEFPDLKCNTKYFGFP